jgi:hypothetical protein
MNTTETNYRPFTHPTLAPGEHVFHAFRGNTQIGALTSDDYGVTWRASRLFQGQAVGERGRLTFAEGKTFVERT